MTLTLITIIYLVGVVVAYVVGKYGYKYTYPADGWTIGLRVQLMIYSLLSFILVLLSIASIIYHNWDNNKPAKW